MAIAGFVPFWRRHRRLCAEWLLVIVPYVLVASMYQMWWGGLSSPARFAGSTLLLLVVPAASAWASTTHAVTRTVHAVALALSVGTSCCC